MPIIIVLILAALVATFGFWDTVQGILGAIGVVILIVVLIAGLVAAFAMMLWNRGKRRLTGR
jgi:chromate transport protein ChrA